MTNQDESFGQVARKGIALTGLADGLRFIVEFVVSVTLARLLLPEQFGVIAVVGGFIQLSWLVGNLGMANAIVQTQDLRLQDIRTATTISFSAATILALVGGTLAPVIAQFFEMPQLASVMPFLVLGVPMAGLFSISQALLRRRLQFIRLAAVEFFAALIHGAVGIGLAVGGYGIWSLVWAPLASSVWTLTATSVLSRNFPAFAWNRGSVQKFWRYGGGITLKNSFVYLGRNLDRFITAKQLGEAATGFYSRASNLTRIPQARLVRIIYGVTFPIFCRLRAEPARFKDSYLKATTLVAVIVSPLLLGLAALAKDFTLAVFGEQWVGMISPLQVLCFAALLTCLATLSGAAIEATGRVRLEVYVHVGQVIVLFFGCLFGAQYGLVGVAFGVVAASAFLFVAKAFAVQMAIGLPIKDYLAAVLPPSIASAVMAGALAGLGHLWSDALNHWPRLILGVTLGAGLYTSIMLVIARDQLVLLIFQFKSLARSRARKTRGISGPGRP